MSTRNRFRRLVATAAVSALPLAGAGALITAQPASAQFIPVGGSPFAFGPGAFFPGAVPFGAATPLANNGINFAPNNSTTTVNNFGTGNTTVIDNGDGFDSGCCWDNGPGFDNGCCWDNGPGWNNGFSFPWSQDDWSWNPGWDGGWGW